MAGCVYTTTRVILIAFSFVFWLAGGVLVGVGVWYLVDSNASTLLNVAISDDALLRSATIIIVVVGAVMFVIGTVGCAGAVLENATCLYVFGSVVVLLIFAQLVAGILAGIYYDPIVYDLSQMMNETLKLHYLGHQQQTPETEAWDALQVQMKCCGVEGPSDWVGSWWHTNYTNGTEPTWPVPATCCVLINTDPKSPLPKDSNLCSLSASSFNASYSADYLHFEGCRNAYLRWIENHVAVLIGIAIGLIAIQVFQIIAAFCLASAVRNKGTIA